MIGTTVGSSLLVLSALTFAVAVIAFHDRFWFLDFRRLHDGENWYFIMDWLYELIVRWWRRRRWSDVHRVYCYMLLVTCSFARVIGTLLQVIIELSKFNVHLSHVTGHCAQAIDQYPWVVIDQIKLIIDQWFMFTSHKLHVILYKSQIKCHISLCPDNKSQIQVRVCYMYIIVYVYITWWDMIASKILQPNKEKNHHFLTSHLNVNHYITPLYISSIIYVEKGKSTKIVLLLK